MLYSSERNYGCRFLEIAIFDYRALIIENEKIRIIILLDKGAEIIEFNHKKTDTDFLWRSPLGLSCLKKIQLALKDEQILTDGYTGGWFEAFPNIGASCSYKGARIPHYGEVCYLPWEYTVQKDDPDEVNIKCFVRTSKMPFYMEKTFSIKSGIPTLFIEESVKNLSREILAYQWGHHPNFGPPFLDENCLINLPDGEVSVDFTPPDARLTQGSKGYWPLVEGRNGSMIDLRVVLPVGSGICEEIAVNNLKAGWTTVFNRQKQVGIKLEWDVQMFPHTLIWQVCNGDSGYPRYGSTHVLGFLPRNDTVRGLENSVRAGKCPVINPDETKNFWIAATVIKN